jgi:DNA-binding NarL/FixJ family response regulator
VQAVQLGARGYIVKPFTKDLLLSRVHPLLKYSPGKMAAVDLTMKLVHIENTFPHGAGADFSPAEWQENTIKTLTALRKKDKYIARVKVEIDRIFMLIRSKNTAQALGRIKKLIDDLGVRHIVFSSQSR